MYKNSTDIFICKAKTLETKEWIEGYVVKTKEHTYICYADQYDDDLLIATKNIMIPVDPDTVCRFTGIVDDNNKKVFENDKLKCLTSNPDGSDKVVDFVLPDITDFEAMGFLDFCIKIENIGNIFDEAPTISEIPVEYRWKGSAAGSASRSRSPVARILDDLTLDELRCPKCGEKSLYQHFNEYMMGIGTYWIDCENCDWAPPESTNSSDCGDNICELKEWLEAYELLGRPKDKLDEDLRLYFYPEGDFREEMRRRFEKMRENNNFY